MRDGGTTKNTEQMDARFGSWKSIAYWCCELLRLTEGEKGYWEPEYITVCILTVFYTETQFFFSVLSNQTYTQVQKLSQMGKIKAGITSRNIKKNTNTHKNKNTVITIKIFSNLFLQILEGWWDRAASFSGKVIKPPLMPSHREGNSRF